jgi:hypothetical protein
MISNGLEWPPIAPYAYIRLHTPPYATIRLHCLSHGSSIHPQVNLCQLYLQEDPYNFLRADVELQERLDQRLADGSVARNLSYSLYLEVVGPFLRSASPLLYAAVSHQRRASEVDLFFWAVFMGNVHLARELWAHVENPLHCALIASHLLQKMHGKVSWGKAKVKEAHETLERWAISVLDGVEEQVGLRRMAG